MGYFDTDKQINPPDIKFVYTMEGLVTINATLVGIDGDEDKLIKAGTLLGRITSSGYYNVYDASATDGREIPVGVLMYDITINEGETINAPIIVLGTLIKEYLTGYDANAQELLNAKEIPLTDEKTLVVLRGGLKVVEIVEGEGGGGS